MCRGRDATADGGDDVPVNVRQPQVIDESIGAQPQVRVGDADAELLGEHAGGLVDLGVTQGQGGRLPGPPQDGREAVRRMVLGAEQQQGRGISEDQCIAELGRGQRAWRPR